MTVTRAASAYRVRRRHPAARSDGTGAPSARAATAGFGEHRARDDPAHPARVTARASAGRTRREPTAPRRLGEAVADPRSPPRRGPCVPASPITSQPSRISHASEPCFATIPASSASACGHPPRDSPPARRRRRPALPGQRPEHELPVTILLPRQKVPGRDQPERCQAPLRVRDNSSTGIAAARLRPHACGAARGRRCTVAPIPKALLRRDAGRPWVGAHGDGQRAPLRLA